MYPAKDVANYIVNRCIENEKLITNQQLQGILYRIYLQDDSFLEEQFKMANWGPYIPEVYYSYCHFGTMPISINGNPIKIVSSKDTTFLDNIIKEAV